MGKMTLWLLLLLLLAFPTRGALASTGALRMREREAALQLAATGAPSGDSASNEGSNPFVRMVYHMGPVLTADIRVYIVWYGAWSLSQKRIIRDFFASVSGSSGSSSSSTVAAWWSTVRLYTDVTGRNISGTVTLAGEHDDRACSVGKVLTRIQVNDVIKAALKGESAEGTLPVDSGGGVYFVLTAEDVYMQDFCRAVCGFHYFTFASVVGYTLPYAWVGNSGTQCPGWCAYPFAVPVFLEGVVKPLLPPNGHVGVDGMINVLGHELAEVSSDPFINGWWAGEDSRDPNEIADLCEGIFGTGGGGSYPGQLALTHTGATYNLNGIRRRKFLVQWLWNPSLQSCYGPNAR